MAMAVEVSFLLLALQMVVGANSVPFSVPVDLDGFATNEYEYSIQRDRLLEEMDAFEGHDSSKLSKDEQIVDQYLKLLKWREFQATKVSGFPPARPIEEQLKNIQASAVYKALKMFPKGGNMHSHEDHELSRRKLLEIIWESSEFQYLYVLPENHPTCGQTLNLDFFVNPPTSKWIKVNGSEFTLDQIASKQTLLDLMTPNATRYPTNSEERWSLVNCLWGRATGNLIANYNIKIKYLQAIYEHSLNEGVIYYEGRKSIESLKSRLYDMDPSGASSATNGKKYIDEEYYDINVTHWLSHNFTRTHPDFVAHRRIAYTIRNKDVEFETNMDNAIRIIRDYPQDVIGFDTVGPEDGGYSLLYYLEQFLGGGPDLPLFLHTAETSWPVDLISSPQSSDPVATSQNARDALLLQGKRLGHAVGLIKHPYLVKRVKESGLAIEICPVSNQILGYIPDLRQHPGQVYMRSGIPVVLGADDPGTMGYNDFTVDWYEVFMAWGLDLSDLRKLALNSLQYSGLSKEEKEKAINVNWSGMWDRYIADKKAEACGQNFSAAPPSFGRILPREGANSGSTKVHIYGRNFESAICKSPKCRFGSVGVSNATYIDSTHLFCDSPSPPSTDELTVAVEVALDGVNFVATGQNFTYKYPARNKSCATRIEIGGRMFILTIFIFLISCCR